MTFESLLFFFFHNRVYKDRSFDLSRSRFCRARENDTAINFMTNDSDYILAGHLWLIYGITGAQKAGASKLVSSVEKGPVAVSAQGLARLID